MLVEGRVESNISYQNLTYLLNVKSLFHPFQNIKYFVSHIIFVCIFKPNIYLEMRDQFTFEK